MDVKMTAFILEKTYFILMLTVVYCRMTKTGFWPLKNRVSEAKNSDDSPGFRVVGKPGTFPTSHYLWSSKGKLTPFPSQFPSPSQASVGPDLAGGEPLVEGLGHPHDGLRRAHGAEVLLVVVGEGDQLIAGLEWKDVAANSHMIMMVVGD